MNLSDVVQRMNLKVYAGRAELQRTIAGGYASDLLSDVMAHSRKDQLWVTLQVHPNIIAVAVLKDLAAIVLVNGREPAADTIEQAEQKKITILGTPLSTFDFAGKLYGLGIKG